MGQKKTSFTWKSEIISWPKIQLNLFSFFIKKTTKLIFLWPNTIQKGTKLLIVFMTKQNRENTVLKYMWHITVMALWMLMKCSCMYWEICCLLGTCSYSWNYLNILYLIETAVVSLQWTSHLYVFHIILYKIYYIIH